MSHSTPRLSIVLRYDKIGFSLTIAYNNVGKLQRDVLEAKDYIRG